VICIFLLSRDGREPFAVEEISIEDHDLGLLFRKLDSARLALDPFFLESSFEELGMQRKVAPVGDNFLLTFPTRRVIMSPLLYFELEVGCQEVSSESESEVASEVASEATLAAALKVPEVAMSLRWGGCRRRQNLAELGLPRSADGGGICCDDVEWPRQLLTERRR
jgi:hypothetical protein